MANLTDPLIRAVQGTDPQNLMEYITRQKIYDSRFWKEECFGLTAADVLERAAKSLRCIGGTFGANQQPTKFLCLTLKLLQLQPDSELVIQEFIEQDHFKYVKALGAFYLRLTGRPAEIYQALEPCYSDYSKLKVRLLSEWKLQYMDEFIHDLLTQRFCCGIALPRLPFRETLEQEGYLPEGPRPSALKDVLQHMGGLEEYFKYKVEIEKSPAAIALWEKRKNDNKVSNNSKGKEKENTASPILAQVRKEHNLRDDNDNGNGENEAMDQEDSITNNPDTKKRKSENTKTDKQKKKKNPKYGTLFKTKKDNDVDSDGFVDKGDKLEPSNQPPEVGSEEYWNEQRTKLGLKPLK